MVVCTACSLVRIQRMKVLRSNMKWFIACFILFISVSLNAGEAKYFPIGKFDPIIELDEYAMEGYSKLLTSFQEPSLWELSKKSKNEIYRFMLLITNNNPVCIRVKIKESGDALVYTKVASSRVDFNTYNKIVTNEIISTSHKDVLALLTKISEANFWKVTPADYPVGKIDEDGAITVIADGSSWVFEGIKNGKYHAFRASNPTTPPFEADTIVELGKTFLSLAKVEVENLR